MVRVGRARKAGAGVPAMVKNYSLGIVRVPLPLDFGVSMLVTGAHAVLCVVVGDSLFEHHVGRLLVAGAVVVTLAAAFW